MRKLKKLENRIYFLSIWYGFGYGKILTMLFLNRLKLYFKQVHLKDYEFTQNCLPFPFFTKAARFCKNAHCSNFFYLLIIVQKN